MEGFSSLLAVVRGPGWTVRLGPPASQVPATILGAPLDRELAGLLAQHDGVQIWGDPFALFVRGLSGPESIEQDNTGLRRLDVGQPYPFDGLVSFAQVAYKASYLACVPALADGAGRQPVVYLDTHEDPWAVPVASGVDRALGLLARYLEFAAAQGPDGLTDVLFPWHVPHFVRDDAPLVTLAASGAFDPWLGIEPAAREWVESIAGRR